MVSFCATVLVMDHLIANSYGMDRKYSDESGVNNTTKPAENIDPTLEIVHTEQEETTEATTEATTVETTVPPMTEEDIINILVVGDSSNSKEETKMGNTTILVSVNTYNSTATLYSVLRDSYVKLPDYRGHVCGRAKFNVCYHLGIHFALYLSGLVGKHVTVVANTLVVAKGAVLIVGANGNVATMHKFACSFDKLRCVGNLMVKLLGRN
jgi:anionic cell wall polymer biosynthesis LytR-Cps2A-Psr (LCP) family protein